MPANHSALAVLSSSRQAASQPPGSSEAGFTLMEVLVVIGVLLVLTIVAIPNLTGMKLEANENSAIAGLRSIYESEVKYQATYPAHGFACTLQALGGRPGAGAPTPQQAQVLANDLASGRKSGYLFSVTGCPKNTRKDYDQSTGFAISAVPQIVGKTGHRGFCIDQQGEIKADPAGGSNCSVSTQ